MSDQIRSPKLYVAAPGGVLFCVNHKRKDTGVSGLLYHLYSRDPVEIGSTDGLIFGLETFYDSICFPMASTNQRSLTAKDRAEHGGRQTAGNGTSGPAENRRGTLVFTGEKHMEEEEILSKHGDLGTFIIHVQHRQNSSWQGRLTWVEQNQTVQFRSIWEMVRLIDGAIAPGTGEEEQDPPVSWEKREDITDSGKTKADKKADTEADTQADTEEHTEANM